MCGYKIQVLYLLPTTLHTFVSDTGTNINVFSTIPHCSARFPSPLPPSSSLFPSPCATAIYRRPSISPACQRAFSFGLLLQGARRWQITTRQPVIFDLSEPPPPPHTHTLLASSLFSTPPQPLYSLPSPASVQTTQQSLITPLPYEPPHSPLASHLPYLPLRSAQKI